ncbi:MAG: DUF2065 family protein [Candidatus Omnitrophica bacterium]|nr:DUF2065 family protein [Candidatus Omnitrophota bacterium]
MGKLFLYLIGILWVIVGVLSVFATKIARKKIFTKLIETSDVKKLSPIPITIGLLLILASPYDRHAILVFILGLLAIAKGIAAIAYPKKLQKAKEWMIKSGDNVYRAGGVLLIIIGSIVLMGIG